MKQRDIFLASEGDAYHARNFLRTTESLSADPVLRAIVGIDYKRVLEIGCGAGLRLAEIRERTGAAVFGVDPAAQGVETARARGVEAHRVTAERLPFPDQAFDLVIFGFCLYLCDPADLFRIAAEADRVLAPGGHIVVYDFDNTPSRRPYAHRAGVYSHRMRYPQMFLWNPHYQEIDRANVEGDVCVTLIRKLSTDEAYPLFTP